MLDDPGVYLIGAFEISKRFLGRQIRPTSLTEKNTEKGQRRNPSPKMECICMGIYYKSLT